MGEGADHGVGGVEHVAELVAGGLAEDDAVVTGPFTAISDRRR